MILLSFDTCLNKTYVTLSQDNKVLENEIIENHNEKYHSAFLIPVIVDILKRNKLTMQDVNAIATNIGPGSFTGIRACVTVARVFAQQLNIPLIGVSSLEILSKINTTSKKTVVILDARKQQFYTAIYNNGLELKKPTLTDMQDVLALDYIDAFVISDESTSKILQENNIDSIVYSAKNYDLGLFLSQLAFEKLSNTNCNDDYHWLKLKPLYLQAPPVSMPSKSKI